MDNEFLKYVKPKSDKPKPPDPVVEANSAQNMAPAYDPMGNYLGVEAVAPPAANNAYGEDVIKAVKSFGRGTDAFVRGAADTITLGAMDRLAAAGDTAVDKLVGNDRSYDQNLQRQRAATKADQEQRAPLRLMGQFTGGMIGPWKGTTFLQQGTTLPGRVIGGIEKGVTTAAPYGYLSSEADLGTIDGQKQAGIDALKAAGWGAAIGGAAPAIGSIIGSAVDFVRNRVSPDLFSSLPRGTQRQVEHVARQSDLPRLQSEASRLGPNSMLADVSPDMRLIAQNVATRPGAASVVTDPLFARDAGRNQRLSSALDNTLGPNVDRLRVTDRLGQMREKAGEQYPALAKSTTDQMPAYTVLKSIDAARSSPLGRSGDVASAMDKIETVLIRPKTNGSYGRSAEEFHAARQVADSILQNPNTPPHVSRAVQAVRNELDDALKGSVSGWATLDAKFADIAGRQEAFQKGQTIFGNGREALRPSEDARYWNALNPKQQTLDRLGVRAELDRLAGQSGNDLAQFNRTLMGRGDDPYAKLTMRFGPEKTGRLYDTRDAEQIFQETHSAVNRGSQTAQRMGANQMVGSNSATGGAGAPASFADMAIAAKKKIGDAIIDARTGLMTEDAARQLGRMSVAQGAERDAFIRALRGRANRTDPEADIERTLRAIRPGLIPSLLH